jgi:hypothetical protein
LTPEELSSATNAIWVCSDHGRLIDANEGGKYPPQLLISYKHLHEARVSRELGGIARSVSWFHMLRVRRSPVLEAETRLSFGKLTLIMGNNNTGKSAVCEWIAGLSALSDLARWRSGTGSGFPIELEATLFNPDECRLTVRIGGDGSIQYEVDGRIVPVNPIPINVVAPLALHKVARELDDLQKISEVLRVDPAIVRNLATEVDCSSEGRARNLEWIVDEEGTTRLKVDVQGTVSGLTFPELSHSEQERVILELAMAQTRFLDLALFRRTPFGA